MHSIALLFTPLSCDHPLIGSRQSRSGELVVTRHDVQQEEQGPTIGPGKVLAPGDKAVLRNLLDSDQAISATEWIPSNLLQRSATTMTWYKPCASRMIYFVGDRKSHLRTQWPSLVFHAENPGGLRLAAYLGEDRPCPDTPLFHAPLWNVHESTRLCAGSADVPHELTLDAISVWETAVYRTRFSHENHDRYFKGGKASGEDRSARTKAYMRLLRAKGRDNKPWTAEHLVPLNKNLAQWVDND